MAAEKPKTPAESWGRVGKEDGRRGRRTRAAGCARGRGLRQERLVLGRRHRREGRQLQLGDAAQALRPRHNHRGRGAAPPQRALGSSAARLPRAAHAGRPPSPGAHGPHPAGPPRPFRLRSGAAPGAGRAWGAYTAAGCRGTPLRPQGPPRSPLKVLTVAGSASTNIGGAPPQIPGVFSQTAVALTNLRGIPKVFQMSPEFQRMSQPSLSCPHTIQRYPQIPEIPPKSQRCAERPHTPWDDPIASQMSLTDVLIVTDRSPQTPGAP